MQPFAGVTVGISRRKIYLRVWVFFALTRLLPRAVFSAAFLIGFRAVFFTAFAGEAAFLAVGLAFGFGLALALAFGAGASPPCR